MMNREILYVRAGLSGTGVKSFDVLYEHLHMNFGATEIFAPNFKPPRRKFSKKVDLKGEQFVMNLLSNLIINHGDSFITKHPHYNFVGVGDRLSSLSNSYNSSSPFGFLDHILHQEDFSMLLWGCIDQSPGFSTVHVAQEQLNLTKKHLLRFAFMWDYEEFSITAPSLPGCSAGFQNMYDSYKNRNNFIQGKLLNKEFIYIPSAKVALECDIERLSENPYFVSCRRVGCVSCLSKFY